MQEERVQEEEKDIIKKLSHFISKRVEEVLEERIAQTEEENRQEETGRVAMIATTLSMNLMTPDKGIRTGTIEFTKILQMELNTTLAIREK